MYEELIERAAAAERGRADRDAFDRFLRDDARPVAERRWGAYLYADLCRRIGRPRSAQRWLDIGQGLSSEAAPLVWLADTASCQAELELAFEEPDRAVRVAEVAWRRHLDVCEEVLSGEQALAALLGEIDHLFAELCRMADTDPTTTPALLRRAAWLNDRYTHGTLTDAMRLIRVAGDLGLAEVARRTAADTIAWSERIAPFFTTVSAGRRTAMEGPALPELETQLAQFRGIVQVEIRSQLGNAEDGCQEYAGGAKGMGYPVAFAGQPSL